MAISRALKEASRTLGRLAKAHPDAHCELDHGSAFQLLVATVLSAQTTDVLVNKITPGLFARWPDAAALAAAEVADVEAAINRMGMFRQKSKNITGLARKLLQDHGGEVPRTLSELVTLPGVGRKTANVVLGVAFGRPEGVVVDTHVQRISQRLGWTRHTTPEKIELDLMRLFAPSNWDALAHVLIFHGRRICTARRPACAACPVNDVCPSAFKAENVGRKPQRTRTESGTSTTDGGSAKAKLEKAIRKIRGAIAAKPQRGGKTAGRKSRKRSAAGGRTSKS